MSDDVIHTDSPFTAQEREMLQLVANLMIPPSKEYGMPGAGDPEILGAVLQYLEPAVELVSESLKAMNELANSRHSVDFGEVPAADRSELVQSMQASHGMFLMTTMAAILQCYYQDTRVMTALDVEPRPPFPEGFEVEQGDWSLLDPVRRREPFYRNV